MLGVGLDGKGQYWERRSLLMPILHLDIGSLDSWLTEKNDCFYIRDWTEKSDFGIDLQVDRKGQL